MRGKNSITRKFIMLAGAAMFLTVFFCWQFLSRSGEETETAESADAASEKVVLSLSGEEGESFGESAAVKETTAGGYTKEITEGELTGLKEDLEQLTGQMDGTWSIYVKNLQTGDAISLNNQEMYAASLIKLFVMESAFENKKELVENDSLLSGSVQASEEKFTDVLTAMITVSDNESYNELVRLHSPSLDFVEGCTSVEEWLEDSNYTDTGIYHTLSPSETEPQQISEEEENHTSVEDCGKLLEAIYSGTCVSEEASREMLALLCEQQLTTKIPAGLPEGVLSANKTGETDEVEHDTAIVFGEETDYILCVMSEGWSDSDEAVWMIQRISELVYESLNGA